MRSGDRVVVGDSSDRLHPNRARAKLSSRPGWGWFDGARLALNVIGTVVMWAALLLAGLGCLAWFFGVAP